MRFVCSISQIDPKKHIGIFVHPRIKFESKHRIIWSQVKQINFCTFRNDVEF